MSKKRTDEEKLDALIDALSNSVLEASDDEILDEISMSGVDINAESVRLKAMMLATVKAFYQRPLKAAREAYSRQIVQMNNKPYSIPDTAEERRELFLIFTNDKHFEQYVTAQYRNLEELTDNDIETYLEDLVELGILQKFEHDDTHGKK